MPNGDVTYACPPQGQTNATATAATCTATLAAPYATGKWFVSAVHGTLSGAPTTPCLVQLLSGARVMGQWYITNTAPLQIGFGNPLQADVGAAVTLTAGSAGAGVVCALSLAGYAL